VTCTPGGGGAAVSAAVAGAPRPTAAIVAAAMEGAQDLKQDRAVGSIHTLVMSALDQVSIR
jgi:hypothetical protein